MYRSGVASLLYATITDDQSYHQTNNHTDNHADIKAFPNSVSIADILPNSVSNVCSHFADDGANFFTIFCTVDFAYR